MLAQVLTPSGTGVGSEVHETKRMIEAIRNNGFGFARRAYLLCLYNNHSIAWPPIPGFDNVVSGFSCTMVETDESDRIDLDVINRDGRWTGSWKPKIGQDTIVANLFICHWEGTNKGGRNFPTGQYTVDEFSGSGGSDGSKCSIGAVSMPVNNEFKRTKKTKTWEKVTLFGIVRQIAANNDLVPFIDGTDIKIDSLEQSEQTDSEFLLNTCKTYGLYAKIYWNRIVVYDIDKYEAEASIKKITPEDLETWSWSEDADGTYTGGRLTYTDANGKTIEVLVGNAEPAKAKKTTTKKSKKTKKTKIIVKSTATKTTVESSDPSATPETMEQKRILTLNTKVSSQKEGEKILIAKVNEANRSGLTVEIKCLLDVTLIPSLNVDLVGFGYLDGKYGIKKVQHSIGTSSETSATLYRIPEKFA